MMGFDRRTGRAPGTNAAEHGKPTPGKRTLVEAIPGAGRGAAPAPSPGRQPGVIQAKSDGAVAALAGPAVAGGRDRIPAAVRAKLERALGADFSDIRIHEDGEARALGARAFTRGSDIHFAPGNYQPESADGQRLLAHELVHVIQQRQGRVAAGANGINADPALEREADALGDRAAAAPDADAPAAHPAAMPVAGGVAQRKIDFGDANDVNSASYKWGEYFAEKLGVKLGQLPAYNAFWRLPNTHVHLDSQDRSDDYLGQVKALFSNRDHAELDVAQLMKIAPKVVISETKSFKTPLGQDQQLELIDREQTLEEQLLAGHKLKKLTAVVHEAKQRVTEVLRQLGLLSNGLDSPHTEELRVGLAKLLNADAEQLAKLLPTLQLVFIRMQARLEQQVVTVMTMDRKTTLGSPTTLGKSGPPGLNGWKIDEKNPNVGAWTDWLGSKEPFAGTLQMRVDPNQIMYQAYHHEMVHTFIHELSHAAASTRDVAYMHEKPYATLSFLEKAANADTIAEIAMELTKPLEIVPHQGQHGNDNGEHKQKLTRAEVVEQIKQLDQQINDKAVLAVQVKQLLKDNDLAWDDDVGDELDFDAYSGLHVQMM